MPLTTEYTTFTRDVLGRYICNTFDDVLVTIDPNAPPRLVFRLALTSGPSTSSLSAEVRSVQPSGSTCGSAAVAAANAFSC